MPRIPTRCRAFIFDRMQHSPIQAFTACFVPSMQLYRPRHKTAHRALQGLFLRLYPLSRPRYQTDTSGYNTICDTLERLPAPGRPPPIPDTTATQGRCTGRRKPPIIIRYIRGADHTSPAAGQRLNLYRVSSQGGAVWHPPPGGAVQRHGRGGSARRGTIGGFRRISFRAFAR